MDPIHPIRPASADPAAVDPVRRVTRTGDEPTQDERRAPPGPPQDARARRAARRER